MRGHNIRLKELYGKLFLNYPFYPFLSAALTTFYHNSHYFFFNGMPQNKKSHRNRPKKLTFCFQNTHMRPKYAEVMANSVDHDQTAPLGAKAESALFAEVCAFKYLEFLWYSRNRF